MFTFCRLSESQWDPKQQQIPSTPLRKEKKKGFLNNLFCVVQIFISSLQQIVKLFAHHYESDVQFNEWVSDS